MKKAVVLLVVMGVVLVLSALALGGAYLMTTESRVAEYKRRRLQAYYAAQAGLVWILDRAKRNLIDLNTIVGTRALSTLGGPATINGCSVNIIVGAQIVDPTPADPTDDHLFFGTRRVSARATDCGGG